MTKTGRDTLNLRDAGHSPEDTAHHTGIALPEVRDLQCHDDKEEDAELDAHCYALKSEMPIKVGIYNI
ncbi:hypothetical protein T8A63_13455 [Sulfitobacter sp. OXR-159]|uniref:hypothetical protein n=1 Tax=Sulfitobacter sp. OXR-159 TaxID=3100174 RepID=UPI002AC9D913|nr:hypothetical protein [Sulfitobacter sp. OXR-159]WPZ28626.1 hypothetical protein T8A63_13455 [Sulfitobacter sp. OXR-159]